MSIEEQIDNAIRDCAVGPDAMRWSPEPAMERDEGGATDCGWAWTSEAGIGGSQWRADNPSLGRPVQITLDNSQGRFEPGGPIAFATDAPVLRWTLAPDEVELLASIRRDQVWWRRLWHRFRRSGKR